MAALMRAQTSSYEHGISYKDLKHFPCTKPPVIYIMAYWPYICDKIPQPYILNQTCRGAFRGLGQPELVTFAASQ